MASASVSGSVNCAVSGAASGALGGRGEGRKIKDALLARETVEPVDDFAGRVKAKRVEVGPQHHDVLSCGKAEQWPAAGWEVLANLETRCASCTKWAGDSSERRFGRPRFLRRGNPACGLRPEMRAELTSAEIAMSGS